jgi:hypothetical protein
MRVIYGDGWHHRARQARQNQPHLYLIHHSFRVMGIIEMGKVGRDVARQTRKVTNDSCSDNVSIATSSLYTTWGLLFPL